MPFSLSPKGQLQWGPRGNGKLDNGSERAKLGPGKRKAEGSSGIEEPLVLSNAWSIPSVRGTSERGLILVHLASAVPKKSEPSSISLCAWILEGKLLEERNPLQLEFFPHFQFYLSMWVKEAGGLLSGH